MKKNHVVKKTLLTTGILTSFLLSGSATANEVLGSMDFQSVPVTEPKGLPPATITNAEAISKRKAEIERRALEDAIKEQSGEYSTETLKRLKEIEREKEEALTERYDPKPDDHRLIVTNPNSSKQKNILRFANGRSTNITLVDRNGNPWNVEKVIVGSETDFKLERLDDDKGYILTGTALKRSSNKSNITLLLKESNGTKNTKIPLTLEVETAKHSGVYDQNVQIRINVSGPNTTPDAPETHVEALDTRYVAWNSGAVPTGAKTLTSSSPSEVAAWIDDDEKVIVQTKYKVYSPKPIGFATNPGTFETIYVLPKGSSRIRLKHPSRDERKEVRLTGF